MSLQVQRDNYKSKYFSDLDFLEAFFPYGDYKEDIFYLKIPLCKMLSNDKPIDINALMVCFDKLDTSLTYHIVGYAYFEVNKVVVPLPSSLSVTMRGEHE